MVNSNFLMLLTQCHLKKKMQVLRILKHIKDIDGYASNISHCVNLKERKLFSMKTRDCHILMQDLLHIILRATKDIDILDIKSILSWFFKEVVNGEVG